jgi:hypothetical protein
MLQPVRVALGEDREGRLAFVNGALVGLLVQLSEQHGADAGSWFLESGFGGLDGPNPPVFPDIDAAQAWIAERLSTVGARTPADP